MFKKFLQTSLVLVALLAVTFTAVSDHAYANKNTRIVPPDESYRGKSYGEWAASWWQALFATPMDGDKHPYLNGGLFDIHPSANGKKGVAFLAAVVGSPATIDVTIPAGTAIFVPVINTECSVFEDPPYHGDDEASLRECANGHIDQTSGLKARLDGQRIKDLETYRVESPLFQWGPLPEDNLFAFFGLDAPEGTTSDSVDAGVYLLITPLSPGQHKLRVRGTFTDSGASLDTLFKITVTPKQQ